MENSEGSEKEEFQSSDKVIEHLKKRKEFLETEEKNSNKCDDNFYQYKLIQRTYGSGPHRIGERMQIRDDLYSMLFVTAMDTTYIQHFIDEAEKKKYATNKLIKIYRGKKN